MFIYRRFSLIPAVMFYQVAMNAELLKTEPLPLEKGRARFLPVSGQNIFISRSIHNLLHISV